jgi:hypothetical protein
MVSKELSMPCPVPNLIMPPSVVAKGKEFKREEKGRKGRGGRLL